MLFHVDEWIVLQPEKVKCRSLRLYETHSEEWKSFLWLKEFHSLSRSTQLDSCNDKAWWTRMLIVTFDWVIRTAISLYGLLENITGILTTAIQSSTLLVCYTVVHSSVWRSSQLWIWVNLNYRLMVSQKAGHNLTRMPQQPQHLQHLQLFKRIDWVKGMYISWNQLSKKSEHWVVYQSTKSKNTL